MSGFQQTKPRGIIRITSQFQQKQNQEVSSG